MRASDYPDECEERCAEGCVVAGCPDPCRPTRCACDRHFAELPGHEQAAYFEAVADALSAPNVMRARREARLRVEILLRGVRV